MDGRTTAPGEGEREYLLFHGGRSCVREPQSGGRQGVHGLARPQAPWSCGSAFASVWGTDRCVMAPGPVVKSGTASAVQDHWCMRSMKWLAQDIVERGCAPSRTPCDRRFLFYSHDGLGLGH